VQGLRLRPRDEVELDKAFSRVPHDLAIKHQPAYRVVVEGHPLPLHPMVRDEVYSIGREAVINAFRHSAATEILVAIGYSRDCLCLSVRDDGCGIDPHILSSGRSGHWGLLGMRERAERIDAELIVRSDTARGTEIRLTVPGRSAFSRLPDNGRHWWFGGQILRGKGSKDLN
jgi:signal transduction histidine kinase